MATVAGPDPAVQGAVTYLQSRGVPVTPENVLRTLMANARGDGAANVGGSSSGPAPLNLRGAGIPDASPMPQRSGRPRPRRPVQRALPTPPIPPDQVPPEVSPGQGRFSDEYGSLGNQTTSAQPTSDLPAMDALSGMPTVLSNRGQAPATTPGVDTDTGQLTIDPLTGMPAPATSADQGPAALGAGILAGVPLLQMLIQRLTGSNTPQPAPVVPSPAPAVPPVPNPNAEYGPGSPRGSGFDPEYGPPPPRPAATGGRPPSGAGFDPEYAPTRVPPSGSGFSPEYSPEANPGAPPSTPSGPGFGPEYPTAPSVAEYEALSRGGSIPAAATPPAEGPVSEAITKAVGDTPEPARTKTPRGRVRGPRISVPRI